jgi:signal transduction histidine kinase
VSTQAELPSVAPAFGRLEAIKGSRSVRYAAGVLLVAAAYYGSAKLGQVLRYTGSVSAIWPPAGIGIAALYLWGVRWWPGVFLAELVLNGELLFASHPLPLGSLVGQQAGNMIEIVVGAILLQRLMGPRAAMDRVDHVAGVIVAAAVATAISAVIGTLSMLAGGVIDDAEAPTFFRTWFLGDFAGALVFIPLVLAWLPDPSAAWARLRTVEGALLITVVTALSIVAVSTADPVTYVVFPALIWAAFRFGPPGATLSIFIATGLAIGITADEAGPFFTQQIDHATVSTQAYIVVIALTTLFLSAVVCEHERSAAALVAIRHREGERAVEERHRIARDLHDSVSQALFSTLLHTRTAQKAMAHQEPGNGSTPMAQSLIAIADLTKGAQSEMRALIYELSRGPVENGLVEAITRHASKLTARDGLIIDVQPPDGAVELDTRAENQLFAIAREALANVVKHAGATAASVRVDALADAVVVEVRDNGRGFDPAVARPGHFGLDSMRSRAAEIGGRLSVESVPGRGTVVRAEAPARAEAAPDGL